MTPLAPKENLPLIKLLNHALAERLLSLLRCKSRYFASLALHRDAIAEEFLDHADDEEDLADRLAERIIELGGTPEFHPAELDHTERGTASPVEDLSALLARAREDLLVERQSIQEAQGMRNEIRDRDSGSFQLLEEVERIQESHARDLSRLISQLEAPDSQFEAA